MSAGAFSKPSCRRSSTYLPINASVTCGTSPVLPIPADCTAARNFSAGIWVPPLRRLRRLRRLRVGAHQRSMEFFRWLSGSDSIAAVNLVSHSP